ncbi:ABC-type sugar transport system, permease component [Hoeflea sp. IMCC20628]|uniref:carbohydrate ABC transporter permease n=1 Tax=Hoeflea sp. IMCC20628 TaxID=1620421 RepID=UPI00063AF979|nr:carbohydrate ABC transporter permease [Hoeflea sp. IMCC20628]AKI00748.1 ABC-type sugar transport system, permease component [Hoeflea sp. IMCC20628]
MTIRPGRLFRTACIILVSLLFFLPVWWVAVSALRPQEEIFKYLSPLSPWTLWPRDASLTYMIELWQGPFATAILNSIYITVVTLVIGLLISAMAGFALAVMNFRFRETIFFVIVVSFLIPFDAIALPLFGILNKGGLQNTYTGLILPGIGNGLAVFLFRQFFMGIPKEIREAAQIDGMGWFGIFWRIYLPLSRPAIISAGLILFVFQWQAYLWPLIIAPAPEYKVAAIAIAQFADLYGVNYSLIFSAAFFISLIPMLVLVVFQRYFTASVASSSSKG